MDTLALLLVVDALAVLAAGAVLGREARRWRARRAEARPAAAVVPAVPAQRPPWVEGDRGRRTLGQIFEST